MNTIQRNSSAFAQAILDDVKESTTVMSDNEITVDEVYALQLAEAEHLDPALVVELEMLQTADPDWPTLLDAANKRITALEAQLREANAGRCEALEDMVRQHCGMGDGTYQHFWMSSYESAFRELTDAGIMRQIDRVSWVFVADKQSKGGA